MDFFRVLRLSNGIAQVCPSLTSVLAFFHANLTSLADRRRSSDLPFRPRFIESRRIPFSLYSFASPIVRTSLILKRDFGMQISCFPLAEICSPHAFPSDIPRTPNRSFLAESIQKQAWNFIVLPHLFFPRLSVRGVLLSKRIDTFLFNHANAAWLFLNQTAEKKTPFFGRVSCIFQSTERYLLFSDSGA